MTSRKSPRKVHAVKQAAPAKPQRSKRSEAEKIATERALSRERQAGLYDKAMQLFHAGQFAKAIDQFQVVAAGPNREMAHSARVHRAVCEQRLARNEVKLSTPEEHYNYAVALINRRDLQLALEHLERALDDIRDGDHIHYAMAICHGLMGATDRAAEHLNRAVALEPRNRTAARNDPDFLPFASAPAIKKVLYPDTD